MMCGEHESSTHLGSGLSQCPIRSQESSALTFDAVNIYLTKRSEIHNDSFISLEIKFVNYIKHRSPKYRLLSILQIFSQAIKECSLMK